MSTDLIYTVEKPCPICQETFEATKVRSKLKAVRHDNDFNVVYEQINPLYYAIWFCPKCGYAAQDTVFAEVYERHADKIREFVKTCQIHIDFPGTRSREQAILLFKLAIFYSDLIAAKDSRLGGLYLRLAWLYREAEDDKKELSALEKALEHYDNAMTKENFPIGNMNELTVEYIVAQLQYRTGKDEKAYSSLSRLLSRPQIKSEKRIADMARDTWNEIKAMRKEAESS